MVLFKVEIVAIVVTRFSNRIAKHLLRYLSLPITVFFTSVQQDNPAGHQVKE